MNVYGVRKEKKGKKRKHNKLKGKNMMSLSGVSLIALHQRGSLMGMSSNVNVGIC